MKFDIWYEALVFTPSILKGKLYQNYSYFFTLLFTAFETKKSWSNLLPLRSSYYSQPSDSQVFQVLVASLSGFKALRL